MGKQRRVESGEWRARKRWSDHCGHTCRLEVAIQVLINLPLTIFISSRLPLTTALSICILKQMSERQLLQNEDTYANPVRSR